MLGDHDRAYLQFSGGKDSLAALYLARPLLDRIVVMFGDTGGTVPHLLEYVHDVCADLGAKLQVVSPPLPVAEYTRMFGYPSDVVPIWTMNELQPFLREPPRYKLQSTMTCCSNMLLGPMQAAVMASDIRLVIRGAKEADARRGVAPGYIDKHGVEYTSPIWDWTDEQVFAYLKEQGAELAPHYDEVKDSMDCWLCTGHLPYGDGRNKLNFIKKHYPTLWPELERRLRIVKDTVTEGVASMDDALGILTDEVP
jgi:phosphoadenosine phosphosulfate reductase